MLLEQHQRSTVTRLTAIFEAGDRFIYRADAADGRALLVRVFPAARPIARVRGDLAILAHAVISGIPAEQPVAVLELDGRGVAVTGYIAGGPPERTAEDLRQLGDIAGRLSALEPRVGDEFLGRDAGSRPVDDLAHARAELADLRGRVPPTVRAQFEALDAAVAATRDGRDLPHALVHPDCQLTNAICDPRCGVALIDWEGAGVGPRLWPLALVLFTAAVQRADEPLIGAPPRLDLVVPIIEGFVRHGVVDERELDGLADLIRVRPLAIAVRRFARAVGDGRLEQAQGWWSRYPEADAVAERARTELIRRVAGSRTRT